MLLGRDGGQKGEGGTELFTPSGSAGGRDALIGQPLASEEPSSDPEYSNIVDIFLQPQLSKNTTISFSSQTVNNCSQSGREELILNERGDRLRECGGIKHGSA